MSGGVSGSSSPSWCCSASAGSGSGTSSGPRPTSSDHRPGRAPRRRHRQARHRDPARADQHRLLPPVASSSASSGSATSASSRPASDGAETFTDIRQPGASSRTRSTCRWRPTRTASRRAGAASAAARPTSRRTAAPSTSPSRSRSCDELRERGVITEEEFEAKKAELLGRRDPSSHGSSASSRRSPRRCWPGAHAGRRAPGSASSRSCRTSAARRIPTSRRSSRSRPTSSSCATRRTAARTPTRCRRPGLAVHSCSPRSVADVAPALARPRRRGRCVDARGGRRSTAATRPPSRCRRCGRSCRSGAGRG